MGVQPKLVSIAAIPRRLAGLRAGRPRTQPFLQRQHDDNHDGNDAQVDGHARHCAQQARPCFTCPSLVVVTLSV